MGTTPFGQIANAAPPSAQQLAPNPGSAPAFGAPVGIPQQPFGLPGVPGAAPMPTPEMQGAIQPPVEPQPQFVQLSPAEHQKLLQTQREHHETVQMLQQMSAQANAQRAQSEYQTGVDQRLELAMTQAQAMTPEEGMAHLKRHAQSEIRMANQQAEQNAQRTVANGQEAAALLVAPVYAEELGRKHGYPPEVVEQLKQLHPRQMDQYIPVLNAQMAERQRQFTYYQQQLQQFQQQQLGQGAQANPLNQLGNVGATGITPMNPTPPSVDNKASREYLFSKNPQIAAMFGVRSRQ